MDKGTLVVTPDGRLGHVVYAKGRQVLVEFGEEKVCYQQEDIRIVTNIVRDTATPQNTLEV